MLDIYIPTFKRSGKLQEYIQSIKGVTTVENRVICIVERTDMDSYTESIKGGAIAIINHRKNNYAGAINSAFECLQSEVFFCGADDLKFYLGWDTTALPLLDTYKVVGTNDLHNQEVMDGIHATHYFVRGDYVTESEILPEEYSHNYTDREFVGRAKFKGVFTPCLASVVEHLHFTFGLSAKDETYEKTQLHVMEDRDIYEARRDAWNRL